MGWVNHDDLKAACYLWVKACHCLRRFKYVFVRTTAAILMAGAIHIDPATSIEILVETPISEINLIPSPTSPSPILIIAHHQMRMGIGMRSRNVARTFLYYCYCVDLAAG